MTSRLALYAAGIPLAVLFASKALAADPMSADGQAADPDRPSVPEGPRVHGVVAGLCGAASHPMVEG